MSSMFVGVVLAAFTRRDERQKSRRRTVGLMMVQTPTRKRRRHDRQVDSNAHRLTSHLTEIDGRTVAYATGGQGLPVLFIHGWGLDHRAYLRPLKQLMLRGCRVIAPSLPGFGGSAGLRASDLSLTGHAEWLARFLDEIGETEPFVVLGHSFGGGVATRLAVENPSCVSSLVLVNSVGDPTAFQFRFGQRTGRPVGFTRLPAGLALLWPSAGGAHVRRFSANVVENLLRDPMAVTRTAWLARRADVRDDLETLAARDLGITVLWSDRDTVIPYSAFDTFCQSFGAHGHVAAGGHSWLLTEPDSFAQVLSNLLAVEGERHRSASVGTTVDSLRELLSATTLPKRTVARLLGGLCHHWLLSAPADVLAADLTLAHPKLARNEVRVVIRPVDGGEADRLTVLAPDRPGLLADTTLVLAEEGLSVVAASVQTWTESHLAMHSLTVVRREVSDESADDRWQRIGERLRSAAVDAADLATDQAAEPIEAASYGGRVDVSVIGSGEGKTIVGITAPDRPRLLHAICRWFADHDVSVEAASVATIGGSVHDVFVVNGTFDHEAMSRELSVRSPRQRGLGDAIRSALLPNGLAAGG